MPRAWTAYTPPVAAVLATLLLTWLAALTVAVEPDGVGQGLLAIVALAAPLLISLLWGAVILLGGDWWATVGGALVWLVVGLALLPGTAVGQLAGNVAAGVVAGLALGRSWRLDAALGAVASLLLPVILWAAWQMPVAEQMQLLEEQTLEVLAQNLPAGADEAQRARALETERRRLAQVIRQATRFYPTVLGLGLLGQAGIILLLLRGVSRALRIRLVGWRLPPLTRWRLPFYLVWLFVIGLGLLLTRQPYVATAGLNLACLAALVISLQGVAVQVFLTARLLPTAGRVVYWTVMSVALPLVVASGVVLGLVDQWWDLRRLHVDDEEADGLS